MMRYEIIDYDVWGNEEDGWQVNQAFHTGRFVEIPEGATDAQIVRILQDEGEIKESIRPADVTIDGEEGYSLYLEHAPTGRPEFELRATR